MKRRHVITWLLGGLTTATGAAALRRVMSQSPRSSTRMPALFLGHGNPMNAIAENEFVQGFRRLAAELPKPKVVLCISAHWETAGTQVTAMEMPRTIHDFGGFPPALFAVQYPAPGSPSWAMETQKVLSPAPVGLDHSWGLDHGAWSVLKHLFPKADVPVIQLSLDRNKTPAQHYEWAKQLRGLRDRGVLIIGSGNMVHNLGRVDWRRLDEVGFAFDWAKEADALFKKHLLDDNHAALVNYEALGQAVRLAVPTAEHYLPLLYALATKDTKESIQLMNDDFVGGALTMTSVRIG